MDSVEQIPEDDWTDQDLLTRDEAGRRLEAEIEVVTGELAALRHPDPGPLELAEITLLARRLAAMKAARSDLRS
ncbi:MAG TPA: hypothetical protein VHW44_00040 [Pseudonocardiaceae bacterium]|jgi:hypothetical protein|nr:hypothetical protein [Pseudonocardiaceae bacterium]